LKKKELIKLLGIGFLALSLLAMPLMSACGPSEPEDGVEPVVIGLPTSLGYWFGIGALEACTMAVEEINAAGGVNVAGEMRPFKLVSIDTRDSAPGVPTADSMLAIEKLILEDKPVAIVGAPNRSEVMLAAMDLNAKYKVPQIGTLAKTPAFQAKIAEDYEKYKYCFRITTTALYMANYHVELIKAIGEQYGFNKFFGIHQDVLWARGTVALINAGLEEAGWEIVGTESIPLGATDFSIPLLKVKDSGAQVMAIMFDMPEVAQLVDQWATMEIPALPIGVVGPLVEVGTWDAYDAKVEGVILHICEAGVVPIPAIPQSVTFWQKYNDRWGHEPTGVAGHSPSYDSVYLVKEAIERAGSLDPDAIVTALEATDKDGVIGHIKFDENHQIPYGTDPAETAVGPFIQWQQPGERKVVFPFSVAEAEIILPPWMQ